MYRDLTRQDPHPDDTGIQLPDRIHLPTYRYGQWIYQHEAGVLTYVTATRTQTIAT
jgi:hypothetical protein